MNPELKAKWVAALRSGKYAQTTGKLKGSCGHCCLGVLCDVYDPDRWSDGGAYVEANMVEDWYSVLGGTLAAELGMTAEACRDCMHANDGLLLPFTQIADLVEKRTDI